MCCWFVTRVCSCGVPISNHDRKHDSFTFSIKPLNNYNILYQLNKCNKVNLHNTMAYIQCIFYRILPRLASGVLRKLFLYLYCFQNLRYRENMSFYTITVHKIQADFMIYMAPHFNHRRRNNMLDCYVPYVRELNHHKSQLALFSLTDSCDYE